MISNGKLKAQFLAQHIWWEAMLFINHLNKLLKEACSFSYLLYTLILCWENGCQDKRVTDLVRKVRMSFYSPFSCWRTHGKNKMASLIFFSPGDQDRQNFSLQIFLSLFVFQGHIITKNIPSVCTVLTNGFFFSSTSSSVIISLLLLWIIELSLPFRRQLCLFIVKLFYKNWAPNGSEYCSCWRCS